MINRFNQCVPKNLGAKMMKNKFKDFFYKKQ